MHRMSENRLPNKIWEHVPPSRYLFLEVESSFPSLLRTDNLGSKDEHQRNTPGSRKLPRSEEVWKMYRKVI